MVAPHHTYPPISEFVNTKVLQTIWFEIHLIDTLYRRHLMLGRLFVRVVSRTKTVWMCSPNLDHPEPVKVYGDIIRRVEVFETRQQAQDYVDEQQDSYVYSKIVEAGKLTGTQRGDGRRIIEEMREMIKIRRWKIVDSTITKRW